MLLRVPCAYPRGKPPEIAIGVGCACAPSGNRCASAPYPNFNRSCHGSRARCARPTELYCPRADRSRRQRHVRRRDAQYRPVEVPEALVGDDRSDLRAPAAQPRVFLDGHQVSGLRYLAQYRLRVERHQRAHVDYRARNAVLLFQDLRGLERTVHHQRERDDRAVLAPAQHLRLAELIDVFAVGNSPFIEYSDFCSKNSTGSGRAPPLRATP